MGCRPSKESVCRNCNVQCSPVRRSYSSLPRHSSPRKSDYQHVVALTSTTLGYLEESVRRNGSHEKSKDFAVGAIEAETWSKLVEEKVAKNVPKTPVGTPPGEPETINAWELMEGLDDSSPPGPTSTVDDTCCFSVNRSPNWIPVGQSTLPSNCHSNFSSNSISTSDKTDTSVALDSDPNPNSDPLDQPMLSSDCHSNFNSNSNSNSNTNDTALVSDFSRKTMNIKPLIDLDAKNSLQRGKKEKLILYFTSLRGVRKTYEDCCHVRVVLKNSGFRVDERDVSMHSGFKEELKELLGDRHGGGGGLPKVFVGRKYIGGADEIRRFHDEFQLDKVLEGCEKADGGGGGGCEACGDIRFLPCETCSGSCKIYYEVNSDEVEKEVEEESDYGFQRCPKCNENGLIRCPICCD